MANILDILNQIGTAVYGKDVRQAIIDAIRQCYEDGKAGVNDLQARTLIEAVMAVNEQQAAEIETLTARVEELEEGESGGSSETSTTSVPTFLVESGTTTFENVGANKTATQAITFTKPFTEPPTVLAIKIFRQGANTFYSQVTAQPIQSSVTATGFTLAIGNKYTQAVSPSVLWVAFQPTTVEVETEVTTVDGMTESDVRALLAPIVAALDSLKIGYDGTEYDTAGASLREQINALHVLIGDEPGTAISASAISYDGTSSGLSATNVQAAIDETNEKFVGVNERLVPITGYTLNASDVIQGSFNASGAVTSNSTRIRNVGFISVPSGTKIHFTPGVVTTQMLYGTFDLTKRYKSDSAWLTEETTIDISEDCYIIAVFANAGKTAITPADYDASFEIISALDALSKRLTDVKSALLLETITKYIPKGVTSEGTQLTFNGYIDRNGVYQAASGYSTSDYIPTDNIRSINPYCYGNTSIFNVAFYGESKQYIADSGVGASANWGRVSGEVTIPSTAKYVRLCLMNSDNNTGRITVTTAERYSTQEVEQAKADLLADIEAVDTKVEAVGAKLTNTIKVMVADIVGRNGYVDATGKYNSSAAWVVTDYISAIDKSSIFVRVNAFTTLPYAVFYDKYKVFIGSVTADTRGIINTEIAIPSDAYYVRLNMVVSDTTQYYETVTDQVKASAISAKYADDPLYGKKIGAVGDSITIGTYSVPNMTYVYQIANAHNMTVDNQAIWGSVFPTGKTQGGNPQGSIYSQIASVSDDCDMLIISGGINDADYQEDTSYWGSVSGGYDATLDVTTFCGAFEGTLKAALDKFKGKPILFVFEHRMTLKYQSQYGQHFEDVQYPLMIEMLNKWGIPYVDLFHNMPSIKLTPGYITLYSFDDKGVHPNIAGYRKFYTPRVESALEEIAI